MSTRKAVERNAAKIKVMLAIVVLCGLIGLGWDDAVGGYYTFAPEADALIDSSGGGFGSYGTTPYLSVSSVPSGPAKYSYLKFDLSGIPDVEAITGATLSLYCVDHNNPANMIGSVDAVIALHHFAEDTWPEGSLTWRYPYNFVTGSLLDVETVFAGPVKEVGWTTWDLLSTSGAWDYRADLVDNHLSLVMKIQSTDDWAFATFRSKDNTSGNLPVLAISTSGGTSPVPLPSAVLLLAPALLGLGLVKAGKRWRRF